MSLQIAVAAPPSGRVKSRVVVAIRLRRAMIVSGDLMNCWTPVRLCRMPSSVEVCFFVSFDIGAKTEI